MEQGDQDDQGGTIQKDFFVENLYQKKLLWGIFGGKVSVGHFQWEISSGKFWWNVSDGKFSNEEEEEEGYGKTQYGRYRIHTIFRIHRTPYGPGVAVERQRKVKCHEL